jgi:hypothetical protein
LEKKKFERKNNRKISYEKQEKILHTRKNEKEKKLQKKHTYPQNFPISFRPLSRDFEHHYVLNSWQLLRRFYLVLIDYLHINTGCKSPAHNVPN